MPCSLAIWRTRRISRNPLHLARPTILNQGRTGPPPRMTLVEKKRNLRPRLKPPAPVLLHSAPSERTWSHSRIFSSERCAARECSSSRPRRSWIGWKKRNRAATGKSLKRQPERNDPQTPGAAGPKPVDPKELKAGYQKAIELTPKAVSQMEARSRRSNRRTPVCLPAG